MINRRGRWLEGKGGPGGGVLAEGCGWELTRPALPPDPDAFANYLFVYFREVQNASLN